MKTLNHILVIIIFIGLNSCRDIIPFGYKYNQGSLPETPVNLSDFNTEYDDYNSTAPTLGDLIPFCFSTNRLSQGGNFDIIYQPMNVSFDKNTGELSVTNKYGHWQSFAGDLNVISTGLKKIITTGNEFGPNLIPVHDVTGVKFVLLYSTDYSGNAQINFISNRTENGFSNPQEVSFLNSAYDDMYPTFNSEKNQIYFCSNRENDNFDIYHVDVNPQTDIDELLTNNQTCEVYKDSIFSTNYDDKCPYIFGNTMVFVSNRPGGYGGYDIYYSTYNNGHWSEPLNMGSEINTPYDEYRPILFDEKVSETQTMMVFSSNRPGGKGGFDLYFVGIDNNL